MRAQPMLNMDNWTFIHVSDCLGGERWITLWIHFASHSNFPIIRIEIFRSWWTNGTTCRLNWAQVSQKCVLGKLCGEKMKPIFPQKMRKMCLLWEWNQKIKFTCKDLYLLSARWAYSVWVVSGMWFKIVRNARVLLEINLFVDLVRLQIRTSF